MENKNEILMLRGIPASGKSTLASSLVNVSKNHVRVNLDSLRLMMHPEKEWNGKDESITQHTEKQIARALLEKGKNVIVDDTNLTQKHIDRWQGIAYQQDATFKAHTVYTPLQECLNRNEERIQENKDKNYPSNNELVNMARYFTVVGEDKYYESTAFGDNEIIVDIDGTVAEISHRLHFLNQPTRRWEHFFAHMINDSPRYDVVSKIKQDVKNGATVVFVSARPKRYEKTTVLWLSQLEIPYRTLIMRNNNDKRPDVEVKTDILNRYFKKRRVSKVYDDRLRVIRMWESEGLNVVNCNVGGDY